MGRSGSKHGRSESKQGRSGSKTRQADSEKEGLVDTSQPSYIRFSPEVKRCNEFCSVHGLK